MDLPVYEVYAVHMGSADRFAPDNFMAPDIHDGPMPLDFYIWVIRGDGRVIVVDTAFSDHSAVRRNRELLVTPGNALKALGHAPEDVQDVIITHLHYDHAGGLQVFKNAKLHIQESEMSFATGRHMCHKQLNHFFEVEDVVQMVREVYSGRACFYNGEAELAPGISIYRVGGHTDGLQVVRIHTRRGWVVLASDALHYYANYDQKNPFPAIFNVGDMLQGYQLIGRLADSRHHIIPGHDPKVREIYSKLPMVEAGIYLLHEHPCSKR